MNVLTTSRRALMLTALLLGLMVVAGHRASAQAPVPPSEMAAVAAPAVPPPAAAEGGEAHLILPDLNEAQFLGVGGKTLLLGGLLVCVLGLLFGLTIYTQLRNLPVHASMREMSELIYETCKTYLTQQGKFLLLLELFIGCIIVAYFGVLQ